MEIIPLKTDKYNVIKNSFDNMTEIVIYHNGFNVTTGNCSGINTETGELLLRGGAKRKFINNNGVLQPTNDNFYSIDSLQHTIKNSRKRALDNIFGYALSNKFNYFLTLTFDPSKVDREEDDSCKYAYKLFKQKLQYIYKDVKLLAIPERHPTSNMLHLHILVGNISLDKYLTRAINPHTNKPIFSNGRAVYNLDLYTFGFSTLVKIDGEPLKIANYLTKYVVKDFGNIGYNKKTFFHTQNLAFKDKIIANFNERQLVDLQNELKNEPLAELYKSDENMTIYRIKLPFQN